MTGPFDALRVLSEQHDLLQAAGNYTGEWTFFQGNEAEHEAVRHSKALAAVRELVEKSRRLLLTVEQAKGYFKDVEVDGEMVSPYEAARDIRAALAAFGEPQ